MLYCELVCYLSGGLIYGEIFVFIKNMVVDIYDINDFIMKLLLNYLFICDMFCWIYNGVLINFMVKFVC